MVSFEIDGGLEATRTALESLRVVNRAVSLGSVESRVESPALMTHAMGPEEERAGPTKPWR